MLPELPTPEDWDLLFTLARDGMDECTTPETFYDCEQTLIRTRSWLQRKGQL